MVGITTYVEAARWGVWDTRAALLPATYAEAVDAAGGRPVLLPPSPHGAAETVAALDALVLAGGADVDPALYGAAADPATSGLRPDRDAGELALLSAARDAGLPVLGICRGMQLIAVATGGSLVQHLPDTVGHDGHRPSPGLYGRHLVAPVEGSWLHGVLGAQAMVASYHHQGIASLGEGVREAAHAGDGTVEALELPGQALTVGVLWHPEAGTDPRLMAAFVQASGPAASGRPAGTPTPAAERAVPGA